MYNVKGLVTLTCKTPQAKYKIQVRYAICGTISAIFHRCHKRSTMTEQIDSQWLLDTLCDAAETLNRAIELIDNDPRKARGVLEHELPELYAKLNYAVNTASIGPGAVDTLDHDALIAWPESMPFDRPVQADDEQA